MPSTYTQKQFQTDLDELTKLINTYSQDGGKHKRGTPMKKHTSKGGAVSGGKRRSRSRSPARKVKKTRSRSRSHSPKAVMKRRKSKSKSRSRSRSRSHRGGRKMDAEGKRIRSFRIVTLNGKNVTAHKDFKDAYYHGTKKSNDPGTAAKHALKAICGYYMEASKSKCKVHFTIKEVTKGAKHHKTYGPYVGYYRKLAKPITFTRKGKNGKARKITVEYKGIIELAGNRK